MENVFLKKGKSLYLKLITSNLLKMKPNKKLSLSKIQVDSFVTSLDLLSAHTVKGGGKNPQTNDTITIHTNKPTSSIIVVVTLTQTGTGTGTPPETEDTGGDDTQANDATAGCCAPKICDTAAYCGNTHDGGNGCSYGSCM